MRRAIQGDNVKVSYLNRRPSCSISFSDCPPSASYRLSRGGQKPDPQYLMRGRPTVGTQGRRAMPHVDVAKALDAWDRAVSLLEQAPRDDPVLRSLLEQVEKAYRRRYEIAAEHADAQSHGRVDRDSEPKAP